MVDSPLVIHPIFVRLLLFLLAVSVLRFVCVAIKCFHLILSPLDPFPVLVMFLCLIMIGVSMTAQHSDAEIVSQLKSVNISSSFLSFLSFSKDTEGLKAQKKILKF